MTNIPSINFNKVIDKGNTLFNQTEFYEGNFDKINQQLVVKVNELDTQAGLLDADLGNAEGRLDLAETDLDTLELNKVDKVPGKVLSTNDYTTEEKAKVTNTPLNTVADLGNKVDKVTGKGLSANDYTTEEKSKVTNLPLDTLAQLGEIENQKADKTQESWIYPTLLNGWSRPSSLYPDTCYYKDNFGIVHLKGHLANGTGAILFILPVGYRPLKQQSFIVPNSFFGVNSPTTLEILADGTVQGIAANRIALNGVSFRTEG